VLGWGYGGRGVEHSRGFQDGATHAQGCSVPVLAGVLGKHGGMDRSGGDACLTAGTGGWKGAVDVTGWGVGANAMVKY
jgi:hypothetical protein